MTERAMKQTEEKKQSSQTQDDVLGEKSFKEGLKELEHIVRSLESNDLELETSIRNYEQGVKLLAQLKKRLDEAQQKVDVLMGELEPESSDKIDTTLS